MKEYAVFDNGVGSPVPVVARPAFFTPRDKEGKPSGSPVQYGVSVRLPFGHEMYAKMEHLTPIKEDEYERLVKKEREEKARLSKREGFATEVLYCGSGWTGAGCQRGR